ncbi:META domain-containing protein [Halomonas elongata]|uniref:DUF306 domain protein n=3 Tax=Halomonas elongata TaxID=2746 RepID=E1V7X2_HALED|nr:META domain-containing protein [Halomonas elongata]MBW5801355.1 META domain-containing protein [Halomonas elongata]RAW07341.1 META domain-containing protein [Halomonas elongata]WBF18774.1 META domain-containing protein [Halomonas elongata]WPU47630.1 META domain-containing protein [Halomonas elongata DSM 2581]CBV41535.1 DUF306 domain protein [Halomonas elongata DSM 2581]
MKRMFLFCYFLLAAVFLVGCAAAERSGTEKAEATFGELPASFRGTLPCADCPGIRYQLSLFADGVYTLETVYLGSDEANRYHEKGEWSLDGAGKTLTLTDDEGTRLWRVQDASTLEALDLEGNEIESSLDYTLKRTDGFVTETLEDSYWRLVELKGESVEASQGQREAHLVLHSEANRVAGATGCNQLSGSYRLEGDRLSFGPLATTRMACMNGADVESRFLAALEDTTSYRVLADRLELYDDEGKLLALFAVQHLT